MRERELFFRYLGLPSFQPIGLDIRRAKGIYLYDSEGKEYIDLVAGISVSNTGHGHPAVLKALTDQAERYLHLNVYGEFIQSPQVRFAERLASLLPEKLQSVYFVNSGSEAVEGAMKLAKRFTGRREVIAFRNGYHGSTHGALSILGDETLKNAFRPLVPGIRFLGFNNFVDLERITTSTACVFAETIQAEAGVILPADGFLQALAARCHETGTLLIIDDVQLGLGRTGNLFSHEHYGIVPDILVLAKALGGGLPLGAFIASRDIMNTLAFDPELGHITTFGGHPLCCATGLASLEVILSEGLADQAEEKGMMIRRALEGMEQIREIRGKGLMFGIELRDPSKREAFAQAALRNGIVIDWFLFSPATFRVAPPLTITHEEAGRACDALISSLQEISS